MRATSRWSHCPILSWADQGAVSLPASRGGPATTCLLPSAGRRVSKADGSVSSQHCPWPSRGPQNAQPMPSLYSKKGNRGTVRGRELPAHQVIGKVGNRSPHKSSSSQACTIPTTRQGFPHLLDPTLIHAQSQTDLTGICRPALWKLSVFGHCMCKCTQMTQGPERPFAFLRSFVCTYRKKCVQN